MNRSYTVDASTAPLERVEEKTLEAFAAALSADRQLVGAVATGDTLTRVLSARASVDAEAPEEAFATVVARVRLALRRAGVRDVELVEASVQQDLEEDDFASARDDIVGTPDVAARLGISRQRVLQLVDQPGRFPHPIATVRGTHVWRWGDIADWLAAGNRDLRRRKVEDLDDAELLELANPAKRPSDEGRRARLELGRRGYTAWETAHQRAQRLAEGRPGKRLPRTA